MTPDLYQKIVAESIEGLRVLESLAEPVIKASELLVESIQSGNHVYACGNGGSATDASHFTTELLCRLRHDRVPLPAISLNADGGLMTATANDYGYEDVFARQITGLSRKGDFFLGITTSGNSPNIIKALKAANSNGVNTVALLGRDGGDARGIANIDIIIPNESTARIQEAHIVVIHALCSYVDKELFGLDY